MQHQAEARASTPSYLRYAIKKLSKMKASKKSISSLENQKVDADKIKGGGKQAQADQLWEANKNKIQRKFDREDAHTPSDELHRTFGKRAQS